MRILLAPGSFKGGLKSTEFCAAAQMKLNKLGHETTAIPMTDGGDGFVEIFTGLVGGDLLMCRVTDPNFFIKNVRYGVKDDMVIVGVSECCGLAKTMIKDPLYATSYGLGEAISLAKKLNKHKVVVGLGGSATNDGGAGMVCALGGKFFNSDGQEFTPVGNTLKDIDRIDLDDFFKTIEGMGFLALTDVDNPLLGKEGCSYTFSAQKGAKGEEIEELEQNMRHFAEKTACLGTSPDFAGAGAAGGIGYCLKAFFKGEIKSGAEYVLDKAGFDDKLADCDCVITGEGAFDDTSLRGKLCGEVLRRAKKAGKKAYVFCGEKKTDAPYVVAINRPECSRDENIRNSFDNLQEAIGRTFE